MLYSTMTFIATQHFNVSEHCSDTVSNGCNIAPTLQSCVELKSSLLIVPCNINVRVKFQGGARARARGDQRRGLEGAGQRVTGTREGKGRGGAYSEGPRFPFFFLLRRSIEFHWLRTSPGSQLGEGLAYIICGYRGKSSLKKYLFIYLSVPPLVRARVLEISPFALTKPAPSTKFIVLQNLRFLLVHIETNKKVHSSANQHGRFFLLPPHEEKNRGN